MQKNTKSIVISVIIALLFLSGLIWASRRGLSTGSGQANLNVSKGSLSADKLSFDFGTVSMANGKVSHIFKISNDSQEAAVISKIYTSCMCTTAFFQKGEKKDGPFGMPGHGGFGSQIKETLNPGENADINVVFDPAAHGPAGVGRIDRVVSVESGSGSPLQLKFSAVVTP